MQSHQSYIFDSTTLLFHMEGHCKHRYIAYTYSWTRLERHIQMRKTTRKLESWTMAGTLKVPNIGGRFEGADIIMTRMKSKRASLMMTQNHCVQTVTKLRLFLHVDTVTLRLVRVFQSTNLGMAAFSETRPKNWLIPTNLLRVSETRSNILKSIAILRARIWRFMFSLCKLSFKFDWDRVIRSLILELTSGLRRLTPY